MRLALVSLLFLFPLVALAQTIDTPPRLVQEAPVAYPERALTERVEATVLLLIDIDTEGRVTKSEVLEPATPSGYGFDEAVQTALLAFQFEPARAGGAAVPVRVQYRYRFQLPALEVPPEPPAEAAQAPATPTAPAVTGGPTGELAGTLVERGRRSPLTGVRVVVERDGEAYEAVTDEKGQFTFFDLSVGAWSLSADSAGFLVARTREEVVANERTELTLYLERSADNPYDVTIEAAQPKREVTRRKLDVKEVQTLPGTFGDPILAVENLPGIAVPPFDPTGIAMRGAAPDESSMYIEGLRIPLLYHFIGVRSVIAPGMLDSFDLYPGGAPTYYGRQTGGVLDARLKRLSPDRVHGYADVSLLDAGLFVEAPIGDKVAVAAAARVSYIDKIMSALGNPMPRYDDYQLLMTARPNAKNALRLFYLGSDDSFSLDTKELEDAQINSGNLEAAIHMQHVAVESEFTPSQTVSNRARVGYLHWNTLFHLGDGARVDAVYDTLLLRDTLRLSPTHWFALEAGVDAELGRWTTDVLIAGGPPKEGEPDGYVDFERDQRRYTRNIPAVAAGGFVSLELRPFTKLLIVPGVRTDLQQQIDQVTVDPRVMVRYDVLPRFALKAGTAVNHMQPSLDETAKRFGNPNLGAERSIQHSAGVEVSPLDYLKLDLTGFYHQLDGLAARSDKLVQRGGETVALEYESTGEGRVYGVEVMLRHELAHRLSGWIAYTYSHAERRRTDDERFRLFDLDQSHNLVLVGAYQLPHHMQLSTRFRYRTGQPTTPVVGATYVADDDTYAPAFGRVNSRRNDAFYALDIRFDKKWVFDRWTFTGYLDVQNATNHKNGVQTAYNFDYSKSGKVNGAPLLPIIGIKAEY